ncbi:MAG: hypothetical protein LBV32_06155 [Tannerellaceae bacterium]|jgi:esterase/lipase superfamily enzyme|nr:hypothetical protein [Tannerellaceae bacterium]
MKNLELKLDALDMEQLITINGGHYEVSMDRETAIMMADAIVGFVKGFVKGFADGLGL